MGIVVNKWTTLLLFLAVSAVTGCASFYQYQAQGKVTYSSGEVRDAIVFWHEDEGRLWYLKKYQQMETNLTMRICNQQSKIFSSGRDGYLELQSKPNDMLIARVNDSGEIEPLWPGERLPSGEQCGVIQVDDKFVGTDGLRENQRPEIFIFCRNDSRPDRYPVVAKYSFNAVSRQEVDKESREGPDPCF
jgi:hypothetical protein